MKIKFLHLRKMLSPDEFIKEYFVHAENFTDYFILKFTISITDKNGITQIFQKYNHKGGIHYPRDVINKIYSLYKYKETPIDLLI